MEKIKINNHLSPVDTGDGTELVNTSGPYIDLESERLNTHKMFKDLFPIWCVKIVSVKGWKLCKLLHRVIKY